MTLAATHVLNIAELAHIIVEEVAEYEHGFLLNASGVAKVALVSRTFLEPALDVLWRTQKSISNLLTTFPRANWTVQSTFLNRGRICLIIVSTIRIFEISRCLSEWVL